jgi:hypothetical protein
MGRRLIVLLGLGAAAALLRRRVAESAPAPATSVPPAPRPEPPAAVGNGGEPPDPGAPPNDDGSAPEGYTVKAKTASGIYHTETSPSFKRTRADIWFRTAEDAERAGFKRSGADRGR